MTYVTRKNGMKIVFTDVGGSKDLRHAWKRFYRSTDILVKYFTFDSTVFIVYVIQFFNRVICYLKYWCYFGNLASNNQIPRADLSNKPPRMERIPRHDYKRSTLSSHHILSNSYVDNVISSYISKITAFLMFR